MTSDLGLDCWWVQSLFSLEDRHTGVHPASYPMGTKGSFEGSSSQDVKPTYNSQRD